MMSPRWTMPGEVYAYRTRKPGAVLGLPVLGRHFAYVGQTRNPKARHREHLEGGGRYGCVPKDWADLDPKRYVLFRMRHCPQWVLDLAEWLMIQLLLPVYNVQHNRANPRRIRPEVAKRQRAQRDRRGWSWNVRPAVLAGCLLAVSVLLALV